MKRRIPIYGKAYWLQNANYENNYTLCKDAVIFGKSSYHDQYITRHYGDIEEIQHGENKGKFEVSVPFFCDLDEDDPNWTDTMVVGVYSSVEAAKAALLEHNNPCFSGVYY